MKTTRTAAFLMFNLFLLGLGGSALAEEQQKSPEVTEVCQVTLDEVVDGYCLEYVTVTVERKAKYSDLPEASYQCEVMEDGQWKPADRSFTFGCKDEVNAVSVRYTYTPDRRQREPMPPSGVRDAVYHFRRAPEEFKAFCDASTSTGPNCQVSEDVKFEYPVTVKRTTLGKGFGFTCQAFKEGHDWEVVEDDTTFRFGGCPVRAYLRACPPDKDATCYRVESSVETRGAFLAAGARPVEREVRTTTKYIPPDKEVVNKAVQDLIRDGQVTVAVGPTEGEKQRDDAQDEALAALRNQLTEHGPAGPVAPGEEPVTRSELNQRVESYLASRLPMETGTGAPGERGPEGRPGKVGTNTYYLGGGVGFNNTGLQSNWNRTDRSLVAPLEIGLVWPLPFGDGNLGLCPEFNFGYAGKVPAGVKPIMAGGKGSLCWLGSEWFLRAGVQYFAAGPGFLNESVVAGNQFLGAAGSVHYRAEEWFALGVEPSLGRCLAPEGWCGGGAFSMLLMR